MQFKKKNYIVSFIIIIGTLSFRMIERLSCVHAVRCKTGESPVVSLSREVILYSRNPLQSTAAGECSPAVYGDVGQVPPDIHYPNLKP